MNSTSTTNGIPPFLRSIVINVSLYSVIIVCVGVIGNLYSVYFFFITHQMNRFSRYLLMAVSICDTLVLVTVPLNTFLSNILRIAAMSSSHVACKIRVGLAVLCTDCSIFLLELLALERCIAISFPLRVKTICSLFNKIIVLVVATIFILIKEIVLVWQLKSYRSQCGSSPSALREASRYLEAIYQWQQSILLIVTNTIILITLLRRRHGKQSTMSVKSRRSVKVMILLSCVSIVLTTPLMCYNIIYEYVAISPAVQLSLFYILDVLYVTNNGINFFCYLVTPEGYRNTLKAILSCKIKEQQLKQQPENKNVFLLSPPQPTLSMSL